MEDYYKDGFNEGYGNGHLNNGHDFPDSDGDRYDYERGRKDGERRRSYDFDYPEW